MKKHSLPETHCYQPAKEGLFHGTMAFFCQSRFLTSLFVVDWAPKDGDCFGELQSKRSQVYFVLTISFLDDSAPSSQGSMRSNEDPAWLLSPLWTTAQSKCLFKCKSPHSPQADQMPETSLFLRSRTHLGHPYSTGLKFHWLSMGRESSLGNKKLGFESTNILWVQFFRLLVGNFALDFIRALSWWSLGHFLNFTCPHQNCSYRQSDFLTSLQMN